MSYAEELFKLRKRMVDAVANGVIADDSKSIVEAILIQIMNDGEKNRQNCIAQAESLRKQAATLDGQAGAFASITSIVYNVLNGFIHAAENAKEEETRLAQEKAEKEAYIVANPEVQADSVADSVTSKQAKGKKKK